MPLDGDTFGLEPDRNSLPFQDLLDNSADILILARDQPRTFLDNRHLAAEPAKHLSELEPDVASPDVGVLVLDAVSKEGLFYNGISTLLVHVHHPVTVAPTLNVAIGLDYKLDPNWAFRIEAKDELIFTSYNDDAHGSPVINSASINGGIVWAIDW